MHWTDEAIVLSAEKHGESSIVARVFANRHGIFAGVIRGAQSKANRGVMQLGNVVSVTWQARLAEHMGSFKAELLTPFAARVMQDGVKLAALTSACALMESSLPERHPYARLYQDFYHFLLALDKDENWGEHYVNLEMSLLAESGFGLDLSQCAATGGQDNLIYVSPKSGRAVCAEAGAPYSAKMLPLPPFLLRNAPKNAAQGAEILAGLQLTGYFLETWLALPHGKKLPAARQRLIEMMSK